MKLSQLKMLIEVAEQGSLKAASQRIHKTEPAISQGLKQLESGLGITLFDRTGYRMELTAKGRHIYQHAIRVLNEVSEIQQLSRHFAQGHEQQVSLGVEASFNISLISDVLRKSQSQFPGTQVVVHQGYLSGPMEKLMNQEVDLCFSPLIDTPVLLTETERIAVGHSNMVNVISDSLWSRIPDLTHSSQLKNYCQIVVRDTGRQTGNRAIGVQPGQQTWICNTFRHKIQLIRDGLGWGRVPEHSIGLLLRDGALRVLALEDIESITPVALYAFKLKTKVLGPVAAQHWHWLKQLASGT